MCLGQTLSGIWTEVPPAPLRTRVVGRSISEGCGRSPKDKVKPQRSAIAQMSMLGFVPTDQVRIYAARQALDVIFTARVRVRV